jgi:secretion/DNA translocation related TadE-like protein
VSQRGSATVLGTVLVGVLATVTVLVVVVGAAVVDQRRVQAAADLGALAGAAAVQRGEDGCPAVAALVRRNGARLTACVVQGQEVLVRTSRRTALLLGHRFTVTSAARAGPQRAGGGVW